MDEDSVKFTSRCQTLLSNLIRLAGIEATKTESNVKNLTQNFIDGVTEPEEFYTQMQKELNFSLPSYLTEFFKRSLPHVQQALICGKITIEGIRPPPVLASMGNLVPTTQMNVPLALALKEIEVPLALALKEIERIHPPPVPVSMQNLVPTTQSYLPPKNESLTNALPVGNIHSNNSVPVPTDYRAQPLALMAQPKFQEKRKGVSSHMEMGKAVANYLRTKIFAKALEKPTSGSEVAHLLHIRDFRKNVAMNQKLDRKLKSLCKDNSSSLAEYQELQCDVLNYIKKEREKKIYHTITTFDNYRAELKTVWAGDGHVSYLPADKPSWIASKDAFDLSSLEECLLGDNDPQKKVKRIVKDYLSYEERMKRNFRRSEILRILVATASKKNMKKPSASSKQSLTHMVKKVYGDVKNVRIFSFRSLLENEKEVDGKRSLKEMGENANFRLGKEKIVLLKTSCTTNDKTKNYRLTDKNGSDQNSKPSNLQNSERLLFNRDQRDDESASLRKQEIQDSISLCRQLSRLKITNSNRAGISEDTSESEIQKACKDQNKHKLLKSTLTTRKKQVVENLIKEHQNHKAKTTTDRCAEDKDVPRAINLTYAKPDFSGFIVNDNKGMSILPLLIARMRNDNLALTPGGSGLIFPSNPMTTMTPNTCSANPFMLPQLQKNELGELME